MSLDEPEPIDNILKYPSGYDTLEYSWVKATAVSVRLRYPRVYTESVQMGYSDVVYLRQKDKRS